MKFLKTGLCALMMAGGWAGMAGAQMQLLPDMKPQSVFFGEGKKISVTLHNSGGQDFNDEIRARIFQTSSATAVLLSDNPVKQIQVPAGETVLDSAALDFPDVKAKTKFLVQWLAETNVLGVTPVLVYPTNLLLALQPLLSETNFGVFDPGERLKPLLKAQGIKFTDLAQTGLDDFSGQLAVIGPFQSNAQMPDGLAEQILSLAKTNVAVVWIQPWSARTRPRFESGDMSPQSKLLPSFYCVQKKQTAVVVVQPELVDDLAENPQSQLNLVYFCRLALNPQPPVLPGLPSP
jgi:hypothetical protein